MTDHFTRAAASIEATTRIYNDAVEQRAPGVTLAESLSMSRLLVHMAQVAELHAQRVAAAEAPADAATEDASRLTDSQEYLDTAAIVRKVLAEFVADSAPSRPVDLRSPILSDGLAYVMTKALVGDDSRLAPSEGDVTEALTGVSR